ncbi:uncharacterized protein F5147DRAFT_523616, partial [Suillus discolor]
RTHVHLVLKPRAQPLHMFRTKAELLGAIRDIIKIQKIAVEEKGILHRNCSLNNSMIEDDGEGPHGTLIDWEFAVYIDQGQKYARGGTHASNSHAIPACLIIHRYEDDLESVFYVFIWICIGYRGP